jgi:hypothetical protein
MTLSLPLIRTTKDGPGWTDNQIAANIYNNGGANWLEMAANDLDQGPVDVILLPHWHQRPQ